MEITGNQIIPAEIGAVWAALNDPLVLKHCLPGCESIELNQPGEFSVVVVTTIGPLRARFKGQLRMTEVQAPLSCVMVFEGQGGAVGFAKGSSTVSLSPSPEGTQLSYSAKAQIGGKLAQVGSRLIDSVAKKMSDDFFKAFCQQLTAPSAASDTTSVALTTTELPPPSDRPIALTQDKTNLDTASDIIMVPGWWLIVAAVVGSAITIAGALLIR
ncbi:MAG: carbon monoxide dehydrogenase subunit G [Burkholderiaceae bacterium]